MTFILNWKGYERNELIGWIDLILQSLLCVGVIILIFIYFYILGCKQKQAKVLKIFNYFIILALIVLFIEIYLNYWIICISIYMLNIHYKKHCFYRVLINIPSIIQRIICYTFFLLRLKVTFDNTNYALSHPILIVLFMCISYLGLYGAGAVLIYYNTEFSCIEYNIGKIFIGLGGLNDILWSTICCYMFVWRLKRLYAIKKHWKIVELIHKLTLLS